MEQRYTWEQLHAIVTKLLDNNINETLPVGTLKLAGMLLSDIDDMQPRITSSEFSVLLFAVSKLLYYATLETAEETERIEVMDKVLDRGRIKLDFETNPLTQFMLQK